jgi:hypothetical protein
LVDVGAQQYDALFVSFFISRDGSTMKHLCDCDAVSAGFRGRGVLLALPSVPLMKLHGPAADTI